MLKVIIAAAAVVLSVEVVAISFAPGGRTGSGQRSTAARPLRGWAVGAGPQPDSP